jgi:hypothetical protein
VTTSDDHLPPAIEGGRITGTVTDFDGYPMVGVRVEAAASEGADLDLLPTMTDGEGFFVLEGLAEERYDLRFALGQVRARCLAVPAGTLSLGVKMSRPQGILLVVKTASGNAPPDLLYVVLTRESQAGPVIEYEGRHLTTRMLLWSIRPGRYTVTVWGGRWLPVSAPGIEVREGEKAPVVELLFSVEGARVEGRLLDAAGAPVAAGLVAWRRLDPPSVWPRASTTTTTDDDGNFVAQGLPAGTYRFSAGPALGPFVDHEREIPGEATVEVVLSVP